MAVPHKYGLIVSWSAEGAALVVDVPQLPGCMAHGATRPTPLPRRKTPFSSGSMRQLPLGAPSPKPA
jgi:hypothetical protein